MSMPDLLTAVRNRIRSVLSYAAFECDVQPDGSPEPASGQVYVSVHPGSVRNDDMESLDETFEVLVTITLKVGYLPVDAFGPQVILKASTGLYARAEAIRKTCHMDYTAMTAANTALGGSVNGFIEPLSYRGMGRPEVKGPAWFNAEDDPDPPAGLALELRFDGARRKQTLESMT